MSSAAVVTMIVAMIVLFGGLLASVLFAVLTSRRGRDVHPR